MDTSPRVHGTVDAREQHEEVMTKGSFHVVPIPMQEALDFLKGFADQEEGRSELAYEHGLSYYDPGETPPAPLDECPDAECAVCALVVCKNGDPLHLHHDGCPSCSQEET